MSDRITQFSPCRKYRYTLWRTWKQDDELISRGCGPCKSASDGECNWSECPQLRDGEPARSGRHCPMHGENAYLMVIGLNPSKADETNDDPTIRKCIGFAKRWGYGALCMTNLFAWRDTKPENMRKAQDPIGPDNDLWLERIARGAGMILAAWGNHDSFLERDAKVINSLWKMHALKRNADGSPMHPLYVPYETQPIRFR